MAKNRNLALTLALMTFMWSLLGLLPFIRRDLPMNLLYAMSTPTVMYIFPLFEIRQSRLKQRLMFLLWWSFLLTAIVSSLFLNSLLINQSLPNPFIPLPLLTIFLTGICSMERLLFYQQLHVSIIKQDARREKFQYVLETLTSLERN